MLFPLSTFITPIDFDILSTSSSRSSCRSSSMSSSFNVSSVPSGKAEDSSLMLPPGRDLVCSSAAAAARGPAEAGPLVIRDSTRFSNLSIRSCTSSGERVKVKFFFLSSGA
jgi:hypothetical protein